jgi:hypothetical protein
LGEAGDAAYEDDDGDVGVLGDLQGIGQEGMAQLDSIAELPEDEVQE